MVNTFLDPLELVSSVIRQYNEPAPPIPKWFSKELESVAGLNPFGEPKIRLAWGGSEVSWWKGRYRIKYPKYTTKFVLGFETITTDENGVEHRELIPLEALNKDNRKVGRYVYDYIDVGTPRWYVEKWIPPETACNGWPADDDFSAEAQQIRMSHDPELGWVDALGPRPAKGIYLEWLKLETPLGEYQAPDETVMAEIRRYKFHERNQPQYWSAGERPPAWLIAQQLREHYDQVEANEEKFIQDTADDLLQHMRPSYKAALDDKVLFLPTGK